MERNNVTSDHLTKLALRMKRGDRRAAEALYDDLLPKVYGFLFVRTGKREIAEDLAQDVFVKLVEKIGMFSEDRGRFTVWFWQITRNVLIDHYREKKETPFSVFDDEAVEGMAVVEMPDIEKRMRYGTLKEFVAGLQDDERELFELRYAAEMPYHDIAALLGRSEGSLRVAAMRLKEKIKKELGS